MWIKIESPKHAENKTGIRVAVCLDLAGGRMWKEEISLREPVRVVLAFWPFQTRESREGMNAARQRHV